MVPHRPRTADQHFVIGTDYRMAIEEERSADSHKHQFAWLREAWMNLPEGLAEQYPSPEHLRKRALIEAGFFNQTVVDAGSSAAALRVAAAFRARDEFLLVIVRTKYVILRDAQSQSLRAMGKRDFQASKDAVLAVVAGLLGVEPEELQRAEAA